MQTKQEKHTSEKPAAKTTESPQKVAHAAGDATRLPAWTNAWGDQPPAALIAPVADLQAKHILSQPGDSSEQEADQIANQVMAASGLSMAAVPPDYPGTSPLLATSLSHVPPIIQRAPLDDSTASTSTTTELAPTPNTTTPEATSTSNATPETASPAFIVEDSAEQLAPGQMKKSDFLAQLRPAVCTTAEEALKGTIWSAVGCPWIDHWFAYYNNRDSQQIERALRRYAPETASATTASDYIPIICERVHRGIRQWSTTGEIPSLPEGIDLPDMGIMGVAGSVLSGIASVGSSIASGVASVASGIASVGSSIISGVGSVLSGIGSLFSKGREGGAREATNPQAIQGQLGAGHSLDNGVRSQMEPAFGTNFSHVRIHTDATAAGLSESLNARAFTVGRDVAFGPSEYRPGTLIGDALIAHELAHVVQQGSISPSAEPLQKGGTEYNALEEDADMSAVGAAVSMWSGTKGLMTNIPQNAMPTMRSGLKLQRCAGAQKQPVTTPTKEQPVTAPVAGQATQQTLCTRKAAGNCSTYEQWLETFADLPTFAARDTSATGTHPTGFSVLGDRPASHDPKAQSAAQPPAPVNPQVADRFIDHPTDQWVRDNLPDELRETAYLLPADCADIAVVLRHVWLFYHKRTEDYQGWRVGYGVSRTQLGTLITSTIYTGNVGKIVNAYSDSTAARAPLRSFTALQNLLHPGDILVWEHHDGGPTGLRTGGHTQTIVRINRHPTTHQITSLDVLQGNQPIFSAQATEIRQTLGPSAPSEKTLRDAPGRRIEADSLSDNALHDQLLTFHRGNTTAQENVWTIPDNTTLVVAGPPASAIRPGGTLSSSPTLGQLSDWLPVLQSATGDNLEGSFEAALLATRAMIEGGQVVSDQDATTLGDTAGKRLQTLARLSQGGQFDALNTLRQFHATVRALGKLGQATAVGVQVHPTTLARIFERIDVALESVEETRLIPSLSSPIGTASVPSQVVAGTGLDQFLVPFGIALNAAKTLPAAQTVVRDFGQRLWQTTTTRAQSGTTPNTDDRPLYWARLQMMHALRLWQPGFTIDYPQRQDLLDLFERASRGMESVSFSGTAGVKKILISGFDPFELDVNINNGNPSGTAVLALDGRRITRGSITAEIQGVIFPVRFTDFDEGKVESFFRPFLSGTNHVDMIMTISQGGSEFEVEEWAGRRRSSGSFADNARRPGGGTPTAPVVPLGVGPSGPEFIRTALPTQEIRAELGRTGPIPEETQFTDIPTGKHTPISHPGIPVVDPTKGNSIAVEGSGGGFLSNEIFYRTSLLRLQTPATIPVGHLHVPKPGTTPHTASSGSASVQPWTRDAIVNQIQRILEATLPTLQSEKQSGEH